MAKSLNNGDVRSPNKHLSAGLHKRVRFISLSDEENIASPAKTHNTQPEIEVEKSTNSQYHNLSDQDGEQQKKEKHLSKKVHLTPVSKVVKEKYTPVKESASKSEARRVSLIRSSPIRKSPTRASKPLKAVGIFIPSKPPANWSEYVPVETLSRIPQVDILESIEVSGTPSTIKRRRLSNVFPSSTPSDDELPKEKISKCHALNHATPTRSSKPKDHCDGSHRNGNDTRSSKCGGIAVDSQPNTRQNEAVQPMLQSWETMKPEITPSQKYSLSAKDSASNFSRSISSQSNDSRTLGAGRIPYAGRHDKGRSQDIISGPDLSSTEFDLDFSSIRELNDIPRTERRSKRLLHTTESTHCSLLPELDLDGMTMQELYNSPGRNGLRPRAVSESEKQRLNRKWKAKHRNHPFMIHLNSLDNRQDIGIVNEVDDEPPPQDFRFITKNIFSGQAIQPDPAAIYGCSCGPNCEPKSCNCVLERSYEVESNGKTWGLPYNNSESERRLTKAYLSSKLAIHECNAACLCPPSCRNKRITLPNDLYLEIFKTVDRGWGLRSKDFIFKGSFIDTYRGEVLTDEEASNRSEQSTGKNVYLFNLDKFASDIPPGEKHFVIDAEFFGSAARFINHSCDPNLRVFCVSLLRGNPRVYELALFAIRDIMPEEELCFDYQSKNGEEEMMLEDSPELDNAEEKGFDCRCGAPQCRRRCW